MRLPQRFPRMDTSGESLAEIRRVDLEPKPSRDRIRSNDATRSGTFRRAPALRGHRGQTLSSRWKG